MYSIKTPHKYTVCPLDGGAPSVTAIFVGSGLSYPSSNVCISHCAKNVDKGINLIILSPIMDR